MDKKRIPSAIPIYGAAAVWLVMGLILPIYRLWAIFLTLALSAASAAPNTWVWRNTSF